MVWTLGIFVFLSKRIRNWQDQQRVLCDEGRKRTAVESLEVVCDEPDKKRRKLLPSTPAACQTISIQYVNLILGWLKDDKISTIGIYGMGGIGKTILAEKIYDSLSYSNIPFNDDDADLFTAVAWVSVGIGFHVYDLQDKIAKAFSADVKYDKDVNRRAAILYASLACKTKCILFLDDIWEDFRRENVGIPKHCKLVLTCRSLDVCRIMRCQQVVKIDPLPEGEAWLLFSQTLGYNVLNNKEIRQIAECICRLCAGVPLAITSLAASMRGVDQVSKWTEALKGLTRTPKSTSCLAKTISVLKRSYNNLRNTKLKECFLHSALYLKGYDMTRDKLVRLWIENSLINEQMSWQSQYDSGHSILNKLINDSLLELSEDSLGVKMNDLHREMAISIVGV